MRCRPSCKVRPTRIRLSPVSSSSLTTAGQVQRHIRVCKDTFHPLAYRFFPLAASDDFAKVASIHLPPAQSCPTFRHDTRPQSLRPLLFAQENETFVKKNLAARLQHSYSQQKDESYDDEVQHSVSKSVDEELEAPNFKIEAEDARSDSIEPVKSDTLAPSEHLLRLLGSHLPYGVPVVEIRTAKSCVDGTNRQPSGRFVVSIMNKEHRIVRSTALELAQRTQDGITYALERLATSYARAYESKFSKNANQHIDDHRGMRPRIIARLHDELQLGTITIDCRPLEPDVTVGSDVRLFRAQAYAGNEPLGQAQMWTDPATARRFARISAHVDTVKRAERAGVQLDPSRSMANSGGNVKKKKSYELPRVGFRDEPREYAVPLSQECLSQMLFTMQSLRDQSLPDQVQLQPLEHQLLDRTRKTSTRHLSNVSRTLKHEFSRREISPTLKAIHNRRKDLPIRQPETSLRIRDLIEANDVLVLVSETGSGKTTQLPQILLEEAIKAGLGAECNIVCTQPRRIAATSVAKRVALEFGTKLEEHVGYSVRFDHKNPRKLGSITYSTAGVLLKQLQNDSDSILSQSSHIIVDEIHERDLTVDILLSFLRNLMRARKSKDLTFPKIILMSATMKSGDFERYFLEAHGDFTPRVTSITVPGRAYPVTVNMLDEVVSILAEAHAKDKRMMALLKRDEQYLRWEDKCAAKQDNVPNESEQASKQPQAGPAVQTQDDPFQTAEIPYSLIIATVVHALQSGEKGDILIFLPGMNEMKELAEQLLTEAPEHVGLKDPAKVRMFKLHSALHETNGEAFESVPTGCRRVILATNIAQTSITLPDVVHVIDAGKQREMVYDQISRKSDFRCVWIDQATSLQRRGRAGRLQSGQYWAMFSRARYESMPMKASPEILTSDLTTASLILKSHSDEIDLQQFFAQTVDAPEVASISACIEELKEMDLLTDDEKITPLGKFCSEFPLHPAYARGLFIGCLFECLDPLLILACHNPDAPLVNSSVDRQKSWHSVLDFAGVSDDDRYAFVDAFLHYEKAVHTNSIETQTALKEKCVQQDVYSDMTRTARQLCGILSEYGLIPKKPWDKIEDGGRVFDALPHRLNSHSQRISLFKALALSVVNTNIAVWDEQEQCWLAKDIKCMLRPYSINNKSSLRLLGRPLHRQAGEIVGYSAMVRNVLSSPLPALVETSSITPLMAMLFGGPIVAIDDHTIEIDGWLRYRIEVTPDASVEIDDGLLAQQPALIVLEFRKAIDRVITWASRVLAKAPREKSEERARRWKIDASHLSLRPIPKHLTQGLVRLLEADANNWDETIRLHHDAKIRKERGLS